MHAQQIDPEMTIAIPNQQYSENMKELDGQIETMMGRGESMITVGNQTRKAYACKVCGKEGQRINIINHIEANHMEGIAIPCNLCGKVFRSRSSFRKHTNNQHTH